MGVEPLNRNDYATQHQQNLVLTATVRQWLTICVTQEYEAAHCLFFLVRYIYSSLLKSSSGPYILVGITEKKLALCCNL